MDVASIISSYEQSRERDIERKLARAEMQVRTWATYHRGSSSSHRNLRCRACSFTEKCLQRPSPCRNDLGKHQMAQVKRFHSGAKSSSAFGATYRRVCICESVSCRVVGKAIFPTDDTSQIELTDVESDDEEDAFWTSTCNVPITSDWQGEALPGDAMPVIVAPTDGDLGDEGDMPLVYDDSVVYSATRQRPLDVSFSPGFEPDLSLCVRGCRPPRRDTALLEEMEEIICSDGVYDDYLALSQWPETEAVPDPDDEFPPFVVLSAEEATARVQAAIREAAAQAHAAIGSDDEGSGQDEDSRSAENRGPDT